jgi:hypothetical protein
MPLPEAARWLDRELPEFLQRALNNDRGVEWPAIWAKLLLECPPSPLLILDRTPSA